MKRLKLMVFGKIFISLREIERTLHIFTASLIRCCKGKQKTAGGFHWKYYSEGD